ncbi:MAG TPA: response regulator, partial [Ohtaekwangia sp.]
MIILYAEDDIDDFQFFTETVSAMDSSCTCLNVSNGRELLDFLDTSLILPDLILLDINMPVMNGRACLKEIKRDPR